MDRPEVEGWSKATRQFGHGAGVARSPLPVSGVNPQVASTARIEYQHSAGQVRFIRPPELAEPHHHGGSVPRSGEVYNLGLSVQPSGQRWVDPFFAGS